MIDIGHIKLIDLIPLNLQEDQNVRAAAEAIDNELRAVTELMPSVAILHHIDTLDEQWVDELAWQFHVDFYDPSLPLEQKRELVKNSLAWHRRKGTPSAVEELVRTIFHSGDVVEWWEYGGEPGYFRVIVTDPSATHDRAKEFLAAVNSVKNTRSWLERIEIITAEDLNLYFGNALHMGEYLTIEQVV
ncbi:phage tail protein I [Paenibacillus thiaminolyticus]|uniref:phage tail protein I n=1 Tax=Paenibacillus thiaminolyticus TaxID=49283 RepID=UPI002542DA06|nr:phage tail protein I [Paenibacillus thiaminolyticus]WII39706.1 phage tail protein I [Paenibacillus thiaminolyticus]